MNGNDQFGSPCFFDLECDAVLLLRNSSYGLIEIKLSSDFFEGIWMPDTEIWKWGEIQLETLMLS